VTLSASGRADRLAKPLNRGAIVAFAVASLAAAAAMAAPSVTPGDPKVIRLKGTVVRPSGPIPGEVLVRGREIACVGPSCPADGATVIETEGIIYPGLIDAHNHTAFDLFDEHDWNPGPIYQNHNAWPRKDARYKEVISAKKHLESSTGPNLACEMVKYGELKALIAGTTSVLLAPKLTVRSCFASLARTIDTRFNDLDGKDAIQTSISVPTASKAKDICDAIDNKTTKAYVVHVGEGVDETSRREFDTLGKRHEGCLLRSETTIIHGTAFTKAEFEAMAAKKMGLVWSPKSNLFLYTRQDGSPAVPRIDLAIQAGVEKIALGPDWALGGSQNLLDELRVARKLAADSGWTAVTDERLFRMVTIDAAKVLGVDDQLGSIEVHKRADLVVVAAAGEPYDALLRATPKEIRLVMVDGNVLYGDQSLLSSAAFPSCDSFDACGAAKFLCVAEPDGTPADKRKQRLKEVADSLTDALKAYQKKLPQGVKEFTPLAPLVKCPE
jgi:cytosine/adenosine deaminase-related metal-dependent hydrolase